MKEPAKELSVSHGRCVKEPHDFRRRLFVFLGIFFENCGLYNVRKLVLEAFGVIVTGGSLVVEECYDGQTNGRTDGRTARQSVSQS